MISIDQVYMLQLEITSHCNAKCPQCSHNDPDTGYLASYITLKHWDEKTILDNLELEKMTSLKVVSIEGDNGDALMHPNFKDIIQRLYDAPSTPIIYVITNGTPRTPEWWYDLGSRYKERLFVQFSVDGTEKTYHLYRVGLNYNKLIENMRAFISGGGNAVQRTIIFKHNEHEIEDIRANAMELNVEFLEFIPNDIDRFKGLSQWQVMNNGKQMHIIYPTKFSADELKKFNFGNLTNKLKPTFPKLNHPCPKVNRGWLYITYKGHYIAGCCNHPTLYIDAPENMKYRELVENVDSIDLNKHTLEHILKNAPFLKNLKNNLESIEIIPNCVSTCNLPSTGVKSATLNAESVTQTHDEL